MKPEQLAAALGCPLARAQLWASHLDAAMSAYQITTPVRQAAFLAQIGHESGRLVYVREIWGPTLAQLRYERHMDAAWPPTPSDETNNLAFGLGNDQFGDGKKFRGRGLIQITGRTNYREVGAALGIDLEATPETLEMAKYAALSAAWFWNKHGINAYADAGDFDGVCDLVNRGHKTRPIGDTNGYADRLALWKTAKAALNIT